MRCTQVMRQLQYYLDNQLTLEQVRILEAHLTHCAACQDELFLLEEVTHTLRTIRPVEEPANLTRTIMQQVAAHPRMQLEQSSYKLLRPSLLELLAAIILATVTTFGIILAQPPLRISSLLGNDHDFLSLVFINMQHQLIGINNSTVTLVLWIVGTVLGICITLMVAGSEMRTLWYKAMMERLPVW